jgi:hypothetical protein
MMSGTLAPIISKRASWIALPGSRFLDRASWIANLPVQIERVELSGVLN